MDVLNVVGYVAAVLMGVTLGLIGGGGSILTVPILVYIFGVEPVLSTAYSLFIVGLTSLVGSLSYFRSGLVKIRTAILFGIPSIFAVYMVRRFIVPAIPDTLFTVGIFEVNKALMILVVFAILMVLAALSMIKKKKQEIVASHLKKNNSALIAVEGIIVGGLTGLVGAGGGFLIIPALVLFAGLGMKEAVGTSLLIIALKSLIGFTGDLSSGQLIDYKFLAIFSVFAIGGILLGTYLTKYFSNDKLKTSFGYFVLIMGCYILIKELFL